MIWPWRNLKVLLEKEIPAIKTCKLPRFLSAAPSWWALLAGHLGHGGETLIQQFTAASPIVNGDVSTQVSVMDFSAQFKLGDTLNPHWSLATSVRRMCENYVWLKTPGATEQIATYQAISNLSSMDKSLRKGKKRKRLSTSILNSMN